MDGLEKNPYPMSCWYTLEKKNTTQLEICPSVLVLSLVSQTLHIVYAWRMTVDVNYVHIYLLYRNAKVLVM